MKVSAAWGHHSLSLLYIHLYYLHHFIFITLLKSDTIYNTFLHLGLLLRDPSPLTFEPPAPPKRFQYRFALLLGENTQWNYPPSLTGYVLQTFGRYDLSSTPTSLSVSPTRRSHSTPDSASDTSTCPGLGCPVPGATPSSLHRVHVSLHCV